MKNRLKFQSAIITSLLLITLVASQAFAQTPSTSISPSTTKHQAKINACEKSLTATKKQLTQLNTRAINVMDQIDMQLQNVTPPVIDPSLAAKRVAITTQLSAMQEKVNTFTCVDKDITKLHRAFIVDMKTIVSDLAAYRKSVRVVVKDNKSKKSVQGVKTEKAEKANKVNTDQEKQVSCEAKLPATKANLETAIAKAEKIKTQIDAGLTLTPSVDVQAKSEAVQAAIAKARASIEALDCTAVDSKTQIKGVKTDLKNINGALREYRKSLTVLRKELRKANKLKPSVTTEPTQTQPAE